MKNRKLIWVVILIILLSLVSCSGSQPNRSSDSSTSSTCDLSTYKYNAIPVMEKFSGIIKGLNIRDEASRTSITEKLKSLQIEARNVKCKDSYPLKQETLEFTIKHWLDALNYAKQGDFQEASNSLDKAMLNFEAFNDWTMDVGN